MSRANFTFHVQEVKDKTCIIITDENKGQMSVTNDIENVVGDICAARELIAEDCLIIYKDTNGEWDAWDAKNNHFVSLRTQHYSHAINKYLKMLREPSIEKQS